MSIEQYTPETYGRLVVVSKEKIINGKQQRIICQCQCACGQVRRVRLDALKRGASQSCGCLQKEMVTERSMKHGHCSGNASSRAHMAWVAMTQRCGNINHKSFKDYGGRGVTVCERWAIFQNFLDDMGSPEPGQSIDRKDNNKGYSKDNCRWASSTDQGNNRRTNRVIEHEGKSMTVAEWARKIGVKQGLIHDRLRYGWTTQAALTTPVQRR